MHQQQHCEARQAVMLCAKKRQPVRTRTHHANRQTAPLAEGGDLDQTSQNTCAANLGMHVPGNVGAHTLIHDSTTRPCH